MTLVSIIIPCYNAEPWVKAAIDSALAQSCPDKEVIVINDGSTDRSLDVIRRFEAQVRIIDQPNRGAAAARNAGLRVARGNWIQFLDADDLLAPDKVECQLASANASPDGSEYAWCGQWTRFTHDPARGDFTDQPLCTDANPVDWMLLKLEQHRMMHPAAWLVSRTLLEQAGPWDESLSLDDDGEYFTRVVLTSRGVRCCHKAWSYYRSQLRVSLSGRKSEAAWQSAFRALELATSALLAQEDSTRTRHAAAVALQRFVYEAYPAAAACRARAKELVRRYGGCDLRPDGGPRFQRLARFTGWRVAKAIALALDRLAAKHT